MMIDWMLHFGEINFTFHIDTSAQWMVESFGVLSELRTLTSGAIVV